MSIPAGLRPIALRQQGASSLDVVPLLVDGRVDLARIDPDAFFVDAEQVAGRPVIRVVPKPHKHAWDEPERVLRSLLLAPDGTVLSTGFPKFFNYGERPDLDAAFRAAVVAGTVRYHEKRDGSLLIMSRVQGRACLRTRQSVGLGREQADGVRSVLAGVASPWETVVDTHPFFETHSLTLEYCAPANRVVVPYPAATVTVLAGVRHADLAVQGPSAALAALAEALRLPVVAPVALPMDVDAVLQTVNDWIGREGVVAQFPVADGRTELLKLKSEWYRDLHALQSGLSAVRAPQVAFRMGITAWEDVAPAFAAVGLDAECVMAYEAALRAYFSGRQQLVERVRAVEERVAPVRALPTRKAQAAALPQALGPLAKDWLAVGFLLLDGKADDVRRQVEAKALGVPAKTVMRWEQQGVDARASRGTGAGERGASE